MAVTSNCDPDAAAVSLNVNGGQKIRHRVQPDAGVRFVLTDHAGKNLLADTQAPRVRTWPEAGDDTTPRPCTQTLGMVFGGTGSVTWEVDIVNANGDLVSEVKHCTYTNDSHPDQFFAAIDIFIKVT